MTVAELNAQVTPSQRVSTFRHILVATDFSDASRRALCSALELAAGGDAQVSVVNILQPDRQYDALEQPPELDLERIDAERQLKTLVGELAPQRKIDTILIKRGPVADKVASLIEAEGIDLLVIGTRGRGGLRKLALGSVAEELLRVAACPVMTIGPKADIQATAHGPGFHTILFATDFGPGSKRAVPLALALAKAEQARLILLHMIAPMPATSASLSAYAPAAAAADELEEWEERPASGHSEN